MSVFHQFVRAAGVLTACTVLTGIGPAHAAPAGTGGDPALTTDADTAQAAVTRAGDTAGPADWFSVYDGTMDVLRGLGIDPFLYPTAAPFCLGGTTMGLAPAVAGAVPGPWPHYTMSLPGIDLSAVRAGRTMFAFVPYGLAADGTDTSGMQVAWFNLTSGKGGLVPMGSLSDVLGGMIPAQVPAELRPTVQQALRDYFLSALPAGGVRAVPVDTGSGTVLAAVFGTVRNGATTCMFLPTVGITPVP